MKHNNSLLQSRLLSWPAIIWFFFFIVSPLFLVILLSFATRGVYGEIVWQFGLHNYLRLFEWNYLAILIRSLELSLLTSTASVTLATMSSWFIVTQNPAQQRWLLFLLVVPFFTNLVIKVYSIKNLVNTDGFLAQLILYFDPQFDFFVLSANSYLVIYGMILTYLPFAFFPIYAAFEKFDFQQVEAANDLGASSFVSFLKVVLPQLRPALVAGFLLVFIPSLGEFVIPDILGGAKTMFLGNLITDQFLKNRDWPLGAAQSIALVVLLLVSLLITYGIKNVRSR